jgi:signal transduction histidine kinase
MASASTFLIALVVVGSVCAGFAFSVIHADAVSEWWRALPQRLRGRGWGLLLIPLGVVYALLFGTSRPVAWAIVLAGTLPVIFWPRLARRAVPYALLFLACYGFILARRYHDASNERHLYGLVLAGAGSWRTHLVLPQAVAFGAAGLWLLLRTDAPGARPLRALAVRWRSSARRGILPIQGFLLLPVTVLAVELLGPRYWFRQFWVTLPEVILTDTVLVTASLVLIFRSRVWAATLAEAGLLVLGGYGLLVAASWPSMPGYWYGLAPLASPRYGTLGAGLEGAALLGLGLWLAPRVTREYRGVPADLELAERASQLTQRVQTLTRTRSDAVDTAAAELRRIERDLHDGAQARLVAVGMSLRAAERLFATNPEAALALVGEAKESSSRALNELRDLVRGIYPPVLADRGLGDAVRALALDTPLHTVVDVDLPVEVEMPVAAAVYFSVAEALANVTKHAHARSVRIVLSYAAGVLRAEVTDDGAGGADPAAGTGLAGVERRLATFDGILAVSSPPGGPTIVVIEVPCASSSAKTSSC